MSDWLHRLGQWLLAFAMVSCGGDPFTVAQTLDEVRLDAAPADASDPALDAPAESAPTIDSGTGGADAEDADGGSGEDARPEADAAQEVEACSPVTHSDGLGQSWSDCAPLGTYDQAEAQAACSAWAAVNGSSGALGCSVSICPDGASTIVYWLSTEATCAANWVYQGAATGHVGPVGIGCMCPTQSDPSWQ